MTDLRPLWVLEDHALLNAAEAIVQRAALLPAERDLLTQVLEAARVREAYAMALSGEVARCKAGCLRPGGRPCWLEAR